MTQIIQVALDSTNSPPVVVIPEHPTIQRHDNIQWTPIANEPFTFSSFTPKKKPFSTVVLGPQLITAQYDADAAGEHGYVIVVTATANGKRYRSTVIGNGGSPTIKNK
jgi:hypothetical protein